MASSLGLGMIGWWAVARLATQHLRYSGWVPLQGCGTASRTDDSVAAQVGSSREESCVLSGIVGLGLPSTSIESASEFLIQDLQWAPAVPCPQDVIAGGDCRSSSRVLRWCLALEGPFLAGRSISVLHTLGVGCTFWKTTYPASDHVWPSGAFGFPLNHPRFLEWVGVPDSASLLELGPGQWLDTLSRDQAMAAAIQLHRDVCLMTKNLDILDQYTLSLQGTASKILESGIGPGVYPTMEVAAGALGPRVRRVSMGWRPWGCGAHRWTPSFSS